MDDIKVRVMTSFCYKEMVLKGLSGLTVILIVVHKVGIDGWG